MWYEVNYGSGWRINYAYSLNGISNWIIPNQTVIQVGSIDNFEMDTTNPFVIYNPTSNLYQMWYTSVGYNWAGGQDRFRLRYATSTNGIVWSTTEPAVLRGTPNSWDSGGIARGLSIILRDDIYHLWYAGTDDGWNWQIGYATSINGINWTKQNNGSPVVTPTENWELSDVSYPSVTYSNGTYEMWYGAGPSDLPIQIVYATSSDGIIWSKPAEKNPVLVGGPGTEDNSFMTGPHPLRYENGTTALWYGGNSYYLMLASDGPIPTPTSTPTPSPTPSTPRKVVVIPGTAGSWNKDAMLNCKDTGYSGEWTAWDKSDAVYQGLLTRLEQEGYDPRPFYYDWRKRVTDTAPRLAAFIQNLTGTDETVDLVGHSLGGLVGRAYLEEEQENAEIDKLLTVGSPHQGTSLAYPAWSAGEIWGSKEWRQGMMIAQILCMIERGLTFRQTVRSITPVTQNLLPIADYLKDRRTQTFMPVGSMDAQNNWLPTSLGPPFYGFTVGSIAGSGFRTVGTIETRPPTRINQMFGNWLDGKPINRNATGDGDNTVITGSALLPGAVNTTLPLTHSDLVANPAGQNAIIEFLRSGGFSESAEALSPTTPDTKTDSAGNASTLFVAVDGANATITDKQGNIRNDSEGQITLINPRTDEYTLSVTPEKSWWSRWRKSQYRVVVIQLFDDGTSAWKEYKRSDAFAKKWKLLFDRIQKKADILREN